MENERTGAVIRKEAAERGIDARYERFDIYCRKLCEALKGEIAVEFRGEVTGHLSPDGTRVNGQAE